MLSIGEFSHVTQLTVKTLRFYHELGILIPSKIDSVNGYRYYNEESAEKALSIVVLKDLGFSLKEIQKILLECKSEDDLSTFISGKLDEIHKKKKSLEDIEKQLRNFQDQTIGTEVLDYPKIEILQFELRNFTKKSFIGNYNQIGEAFSFLLRNYGRVMQGKPYAFL